MKTKTVKKIWNGFASVRDYEVFDAIKKGGMIIEYNNSKMTLSPNKLRSGLEIISKIFVSKIGGRNYRLIDYKFIPDSSSNPNGDLYESKAENKKEASYSFSS